MHEAEHNGRVRRVRKRRTRSSRRLRLVLMSIGYAGLALGAALLGWSVVRQNRRLALIGGVYVLCACAVLAVRAALQEWDRIRKARHGRSHSRSSSGPAFAVRNAADAVPGNGGAA